MSGDVFGSPDAQDEVADDDRMVEIAAREQEEFVREFMGSRRRAVGSKKIPRQDQDREWEVLRSDPAMVQEFYVSQAATFEEAILDAEAREKRRSPG